MYNCNANRHPSVHSLHRLSTDEATIEHVCIYVYVCVYIYTIILGKPKALPNTSPKVYTVLCCAVLCCAVLCCAVLCCAAPPFLSSQLPLIHAHSTITLCLLRNGDSRENDREAETVNKHSEHSTTKCENKFT
jgi:hypothetical protein